LELDESRDKMRKFLKIQDGGRLPSWKWFLGHHSSS